MNMASSLFRRIIKKQVTVGIVGMGYVGSALSEATSGAGYSTIGFDIDEALVVSLNSQKQNNFLATTNKQFLISCDIVCICVPTPVNKDNTPNLSFFESAIREVANVLISGQLIIIESSITPGSVRNLALPILEKSSLKVSQDFFLGFAPERIDPGNKKFTLYNIPKVVSGFDKTSLRLTARFYGNLVEKVVSVSTIEVAEMTKFLENVFRMVNISFINELSDYAKVKKIDILEAINAAATKPFGFLPHYPGPGAGGDCIPVLSYYLLDDAKKHKIKLRMVDAAMQVNEERLKKITEKVANIMNHKSNGEANNKKPKVLIVGVAYKAESSNIRGSVSLKVWQQMEKMGAEISYHDPFVPRVNGHYSVPLTRENILGNDVIVITTDHRNIKYEELVKSKKPIVDARNVLRNYRLPHIIRI